MMLAHLLIFVKQIHNIGFIILGKLSEGHLVESKSTAEWEMVIVLRHPWRAVAGFSCQNH